MAKRDRRQQRKQGGRRKKQEEAGGSRREQEEGHTLGSKVDQSPTDMMLDGEVLVIH
jgi:hypothetical protein